MLDFNVAELIRELAPNRQTIHSLHHQGQSGSEKFHTLKRERDKLKASFGWREKYFNGYFGGNRRNVRAFQRMGAELTPLKNMLANVDKNLKIENDKLNKQITTFLKSNSATYRNLSAEIIEHTNLHDASVTFLNGLINAKTKISDALIFKSWDSLLQHPQAKAALEQFYEKLAEYERLIKAYEVHFDVRLIGENTLMSLVKFASEELAMESFNALSSRLHEVIEVTDKEISNAQGKIKAINDESKKTLFQA